MFFYIFSGICIGILFFEPLIINFIYFSNIDLFHDFILTKKNRLKLETYYYYKFLKQKEDN